MKHWTLRSYLCSFIFSWNIWTPHYAARQAYSMIRNQRDDGAQRKKTEFALQEHEDLLRASAVTDYLLSYHLEQVQAKTFKLEVFDSIISFCSISNS